MRARRNKGRLNIDDRGSTLLIVAASMVGLLGVAALAIDLVSFYTARAEAQRAADAAALAGASMFITTGCTSASGGCTPGGSQEGPARQQAKDVGAQNKITGQAASIQDSDVTFNYPNPEEPQIRVRVARDTAHANALPTFFGKVFGITTVNVSVTATAEVFNPSGSGSPIGTFCLKPWILPNCDADHTTPNTNPNCTSVAPFIDPATGAIIHPGPFSSGGVVGETLVLKSGSPSQAPAPSQYYPVQLPPSPTSPSLCPSCAQGAGGGAYRQNIECCNENQFVCGLVPVNFENGNMQGPTRQGVDCLIHEDSSTSIGQDILLIPSPLGITGGSNNPNPALRGATGLTSSDSVVTIPLYDGANLCPGSSCGPSVTIIGFLQVFINSVENTGSLTMGDVHATVLNVAGCGSNGGSGGTPTTPTGGTFVPIRLIRTN